MPSAEELARAALALQQRESRIAKRIEMEVALAGDAEAARLVREGFAPLTRMSAERGMPPEPEAPDSRVVANQNI